MIIPRQGSKALLPVAATLAGLLASASFACGPELGQGRGPRGSAIRYLGFVSDQSGKAVPNATVIVTTLNEEFTTDRKGQFTHSFNFEADAPSIIFVCKSKGYKSGQGRKKTSPTDPHVILVSCTLQREP